MPAIVCAEAPLKVVVPEPAVNVPFWVKFPATERSGGAVNVPEVIVKTVVEALAWNTHEPPPKNSTSPNAEDAVSVPPIFLDEPVKYTLLVVSVVKVALFVKCPATVKSRVEISTAPELERIHTFVVEACAEVNVFAPPLSNSRWLNEFDAPDIFPVSVCAPVPSKVVVPVPAVNVPLLT